MSEVQFPTPQSYSQEDIQQILQLAIARQTDKEELSREQLWEIAAELEIDPLSLQTAEQEWLNQKAISKKRLEFSQFRRLQFKQKVIRYLTINTFFVSLNFLSAGILSWSLYILLLWGLGLSLEGLKTFQTKGEAYEQAFQRWKFKNEMKESMANLWDRLKKAWQT
ncbi:conserved hypothetical protein [Gloeothece citriformis PCC 7424]|uniref:2TM domain-containing protein n=1 Tax=Gloeothece citriformis (strain PCC 7424) TaxID=65393 RepID=B7KGW9_GLOC7|nr:2TM domain-containing protein [Gloeothece citriformis]ACK73456.1 conserved hypothetical protein [Gloeothece citriformis PCC 7424]